jgi:type I restriction enzyme R subunit
VTDVQLKPEQRARLIIDEKLVQAGWLIQNYRDIGLNAGPRHRGQGVPQDDGPAEYVLHLDRKAIGMIEVKKVGDHLLTVETRLHRYQASR